jgi:proton-translocating NADH-quinone oxidoreductase chain M
MNQFKKFINFIIGEFRFWYSIVLRILHNPISSVVFFFIFIFYLVAIHYARQGIDITDIIFQSIFVFLQSLLIDISLINYSSIDIFFEISNSFKTHNHFGIILGFLTVLVYSLVYLFFKETFSIEIHTIVKFKVFAFFYIISLLALLYTFITANFFIFYSLFEFILIPFYFVILIWGSRSSKVGASFRLVFFTLVFSLPLTVIIAFNLYNKFFSFNFDILFSTLSVNDPFIQISFYIACFLAFAVKIPLFPAHVWLPEAHGEAPTFGSVLLAGVLLKLGGYGFYLVFYEFVNPIWNINLFNFFALTYVISILTILYSNVVVFNQLDIKRTIAYYSIGHMGFVSLGLITNNLETAIGAIIIIFSHGISAMGLFFCVGYIYEHTHTRSIIAYRGVSGMAPSLCVIIFLFICINVSFPGTPNFIGEQLVLIGLSKLSPELSFIPIIGVLLNGLSSFLFFIRIMFGELRKTSVTFDDVELISSIHMLGVFSVFYLFFGLYSMDIYVPDVFLYYIIK